MSNHDLLLVIDLQNVYTEGQPWACCHIRQAARNIRRLLDAGVCGKQPDVAAMQDLLV